jgi:hypothetical protein
MRTRLLDRQVSLLEYLTSSDAVFGDQGDKSLDPLLQGIDRGLLRLEACFSHEKRMEKISAAFPRTFQLLGAESAAIVREFVEACPPVDITRLENARQFYNFLCARWRHAPPEPPYLGDVAACELAFVKVRVGAEAQVLEPAGGEQPRHGIRRQSGVILLRCAYDVRPIFEGGPGEVAPVRRDTPLAIAIPPPHAEHPKVFELLPPAFDMLAALDDWTDRFALAPAPELDELICVLTEHGLVEVRR